MFERRVCQGKAEIWQIGPNAESEPKDREGLACLGANWDGFELWATSHWQG